MPSHVLDQLKDRVPLCSTVYSAYKYGVDRMREKLSRMSVGKVRPR